LGSIVPGDVINVKFYRNGKIKEAKVKLSESRNGNTKDIATTESPEKILNEIGMDVRDLDYIEEARLPKDGVIVNSIESGSQIAQVNMEENFIITRINGIPVTNLVDFKEELKHAGTNIYLQGYYEQFQGDFAYSLDLK
jgi:S1-C subfamily serine protease